VDQPDFSQIESALPTLPEAAPSSTPEADPNDPQYYWALDTPEALVKELTQRRDDYLDFLKSTVLFERIRRSYCYFHGLWGTEGLPGEAIKLSGPELEQRRVSANEYRSTLSLLATYIVSQKPAWDTLAEAADYRAIEATKLGNQILDTYMADPTTHVEQALTQSVTDSLVLSSGFVWNLWDESAGSEVDGDVSANTITYGGDFRFLNPDITDVAYDTSVREWKDRRWVLARRLESRHDLIAQFPSFAEEILKAPSPGKVSTGDEDATALQILGLDAPSKEDTDNCWVYYFYHDKTPAVPDGRFVRYVSADAVLTDRALKEGHIPLHRIVPDQWMLTSFGYSHAFDLQPLQEGLNAILSIILTNFNSLGSQKIWTKSGEPINQAELEPGVTVLQTTTPPQSINLLQPSPELWKGAEAFTLYLEKASGVNATSRGNPGYQLKSGSALAMVDSRTLQAASSLITNYRRLLCDVGTSLLMTLNKCASEPRLLSLVGENGRRFIPAFHGAMLNGVRQVSIQSGNPIMDTISGRLNLGEFLVQTGLLKTPEEFITLVKTGNLDRLTENAESQVRAVQAENDALLRGEQVQMLLIDNHKYHIVKHATIFDAPESRMDQGVSTNGLAHILQHVEAMSSPQGMMMAQLLGYQAGMPGPAPGAPPSGAAAPPPTPQQVGNRPEAAPKQGSSVVKERVNDARLSSGLPPQKAEA